MKIPASPGCHRLGRAWIAAATVVVGLGLVALLPLLAGSRVEAHEVVLVARHMAFYIEGDSVPNPTIRIPAGREVRIVLKNEDAGVVHDFAADDLNVAIQAMSGPAEGAARFTAPDRPGRFPYLCRPHSLMMYGVVEVY